jgi:hypothetical protein
VGAKGSRISNYNVMICPMGFFCPEGLDKDELKNGSYECPSKFVCPPKMDRNPNDN